MDIRKIYEYALAREYEGKRFFESNAKRLSHAAAVDAFHRLAQEEQKHIDFIQMQITALNEGFTRNVDSTVNLDPASFFSQRAALESIEQTVSEAMLPDLPILRMAYLIERDFAEFYQIAGEKADGNARQVLNMLAQWERGHERFFKEWYDNVFQEYAKMPWGG